MARARADRRLMDRIEAMESSIHYLYRIMTEMRKQLTALERKLNL
jgi:hypothetical protein